MRKQYLQILGLPENASDQEIKKAYRRKAFLYHPDLNPDPRAKEQFVRIDKAYQYLISNEPEILESFSGGSSVDRERRENSAQYFQMAQEFKKKQAERYQRNLNRRMDRFRANPLFDVAISCIALVVSFYGGLFLLDHFLEPTEETFRVYDTYFSEDAFFYVYVDYEETVEVNVNYEVAMRVDQSYFEASTADIQVTPIFKTPKKVRLINNLPVGHPEVLQNIFFNWLFPILMLIPLFWIFYRKSTQPMIVLGNCLLFVYPFILAVHMYMALTYRTGMMENMV